MTPADLIANLPAWLVISLVLGAALGCGYKSLWPRSAPNLTCAVFLWSVGLVFGHLLSVVGELPGWRLGALYPVPGLAIGLLLVLIAKRRQVC
ncbi:MAG: hypothetical protein M1401_08390 [Chloroflexi bacterium]|nr:hypothetical protein [Chloroflexota bacterium]MCL5108865.1 hypothetical protein [Chloroflexota bacterium]